jgi:hypothetical protein
MEKECTSDSLVNEFIVYVTIIALLHIGFAVSLLLFRLRRFRQLFGMQNDPTGPITSFSTGLYLGILFVHANQMVPFQTLSLFNELMMR